jgi:hypothetical protein
LCMNAERVTITQSVARATARGSGAAVKHTRRAVVRPGPDCGARVAGLDPGQYEAALEDAGGQVLSSRRFEVADTVFSDVVFDASARLSGRVLFNERPLSSAVLEFRAKDGEFTPAEGVPGPIRARADTQGRYAVDFATPGAYWVQLRNNTIRIPGEFGLVHLRPGENTYDLDLTGGSVVLKLVNLDRGGGRLGILIAQTEPRVRDGSPGTVLYVESDDSRLHDGEFAIEGLAFGEYSIRVTQQPAHAGARPKSGAASVRLTEHQPETTAPLTLAENDGLFVLIDAHGSPVRGARVYGHGMRAREVQPGQFSLDGIPPDLTLQVRAPGYTPLCRVAGNGVTTLLLDPGRPVEVRFPNVRMSGPGGAIAWEGSHCPIALDAFPFKQLPDGPDGSRRFIVSHFPSVHAVTLIYAGQPLGPLLVTGEILEIPDHPVFGKR